MRVPEVSQSEARRLVAEVLECAVGDVRDVEPTGVGFGSSNWRARSGDDDVLLKVGPAASAAKWASAEIARGRAAERGIPVPELLSSRVRPVGVVRVFRWVEGRSLAEVATELDESARRRVATDLGRAVGALHELVRERFSSRLDGSSPTFDTWEGYVTARLAAVRDRSNAADALPAGLLDRTAAAVTELAAAVSPVVLPVLCHRDLHPDNVLVGADGRLVAILDWDMTEAWDPAGDRFKIERRLLPALGDAAEVFESTYAAAHPERPLWAERVNLVSILEAANSVANAAVLGHHEYGAEARALLLESLP